MRGDKGAFCACTDNLHVHLNCARTVSVALTGNHSTMGMIKERSVSAGSGGGCQGSRPPVASTDPCELPPGTAGIIAGI